jgi:erythronate-4-phosphate dehydrogenase
MGYRNAQRCFETPSVIDVKSCKAIMRPKIVLDSAITITPRLAQLPVDLVAVAGRDIDREVLSDAQGLLTRTVTRVNAVLLEGTSVSFVGTASAGVDHVDRDYLNANGICFASAAGCNATAVGDYVLSAIGLCGRLEGVMEGATVGLVGYGNVGRQLATRLVGLGAVVRVFDPFVSDFGAGIESADLQKVLQCSVVSLHASLHSNEPDPSYHMIGLAESSWISSDALLINAGRGNLLTVAAAEMLLLRGVDVVLDTWPDEPNVDPMLLAGVRFGTPHIAGYSQQSKINATDFLIDALAASLGLPPSRRDPSRGGLEQVLALESALSVSQAVTELVTDVGRLRVDDRHFRRRWSELATPECFESQRREYVLRDQLNGLSVQLSEENSGLRAKLLALGVSVRH